MNSKNPSQPLPQLGFNRKQAAEILSISVESLDRLARRGLLAPNRALRCPIYTLADLERFLKETSSTFLKGGAQ